MNNLVSFAAFKDKESILLRIIDFEKPGTYALTDDVNKFSIGGVEYSLKEGELTITKIDHFSRIISGRFHATGEQSDKKITITDGRFDLKFNK